MNLENQTIVNAVVFIDANFPDIVVMSSDLHMTLNDFLQSCRVPLRSINGTRTNFPRSISQMLNFNYQLHRTVNFNGYTFNVYTYKDSRFDCSFIEIAA